MHPQSIFCNCIKYGGDDGGDDGDCDEEEDGDDDEDVDVAMVMMTMMMVMITMGLVMWTSSIAPLNVACSIAYRFQRRAAA